MDQRVDINIGGVTAYRYAVSKGFTGTEEEFAQLMANIGITQKEIDAAIDKFVNITAPGAVQAVETAQASALEAIGASKTDVLDAVDTSKASAVAAVNSAGDTQKAAVDAEGQRVIGTIPADYTKLSREVDDLRSASYNLLDPTGITPHQPTSAAELTRTGFVIRNTTEATYSRGYLYLNLKPNTEYTFSAKKHTTSGVAYVGYSEAPGEGEPFPSANIPLIGRTAPDDETIAKTFTTTTGILVIRFYAAWDAAELGEVEYSEIMVVEGSEEKPFVRHVFAQDDEARNAVIDLQTGLDQKAGILRNTAGGAIVSFMPDASVKNLLGLTVAVEPAQDLHGYDSPWPAGGGVNLLSPFVRDDYLGSTVSDDGLTVTTGVKSDNNLVRLVLSSPLNVLEETIYYISFDACIVSGVCKNFGLVSPTDSANAILFNYRTIVANPDLTTSWQRYKFYASARSVGTGIKLYIQGVNTDNAVLMFSNVCISTVENYDFAPYSNECPISGWTGANIHVSLTTDAADGDTYTINFPSEAGTVYGCSVDMANEELEVNGVCVSKLWGEFTKIAVLSNIERRRLVLSPMSDSSKRNQSRSNITLFVNTSSDIVHYQILSTGNGVDFYLPISTPDNTVIQIYYLLDTPIVYDLAPQQIETIKGQINNVWADAGNVTVEFAEDIKTYIDKKFAELQALALENN